MRQPKRKVSYDGKTYTVQSNRIEIPNLDQMDRIAALVWLNRHTYPTGNGIRAQSNPLHGIGSAIGLTGKIREGGNRDE